MIIKLIDAKESTAGTDHYARRLANYMATANKDGLRPDAVGIDYGLTLAAYMSGPRPDPSEGRERVLYRGARVDGGEVSWDAGIAEMDDCLSRQSRKVKKPARHVVLSYRAGEQPEEADCRQAVSILAKELGCEKAAVLWAAHADTDNIHIHALIVTVDKQTGGALPFGQGGGGRAEHKEAMQRAIARIEHAQSLQAEQGSRYEVVNDHVVRKPAAPSREVGNKRTALKQEILDFEGRSGIASFTRMAQELAAPVIEQANNWREVHDGLAAIGMGIRSAGNGGEIYAGDDHVKLSGVDRKLSWKQLTKPDRFGPFEDAPEGHDFSPAAPRILDPAKARAWLKRTDEERALKLKLDQRIAHLLSQRDAALADLASMVTAYRADVASMHADPRLARYIDGAWPRLRDRARTRISQAFASRIAAIRGMKQALTIEIDLAAVDEDAIGELDAGYVAPWHHTESASAPQQIDGFHGERRGDAICYWSKDTSDRRGRPAIVDTGAILWVNDRSNTSVAASLQLAQARFGSVAVFGDRAYIAQCRRLAKQLGIEIEEITRQEALRRARVTGNERSTRRRSALDRHDRQLWADRFNRAEPRQAAIPASGGLDQLAMIDEIDGVDNVPRESEPANPARHRGANVMPSHLKEGGQARNAAGIPELSPVSTSDDHARLVAEPVENRTLKSGANDQKRQRGVPRIDTEPSRDR